MSSTTSKERQILSNSISRVFGVAILRNDGSRIYSKYFANCFSNAACLIKEGDLKEQSTQISFEKSIFEKSTKLVSIKKMNTSDTEIFSYGRFTIVFKVLLDVYIYLIGDPEENEALLASAADCIKECISSLVSGTENVNKAIITDHFQSVILIVDEVIDQGVIISIDPSVIQARFKMIDCDDPLVGGPSAQSSTSASASGQSSAPSQSTASGTVSFFKSFFNR